MREDFLHYLWKTRLFKLHDLKTTSGEPLLIADPGVHNLNAGPDFLNARIRIGEVLWVGSVELHLRASDWYQHGHQEDAAYQNVILHVVYEADVHVIVRNSTQTLLCLELKQRIPEKVYQKYWEILHTSDWIPCINHIKNISNVFIANTFEDLLIERLEQKIAPIEQLLDENKYDWEDTFYQKMAGAFGGALNSAAMEAVARSIPYILFRKHKDNLFQIEALLFGQAGWLEENFEEEYPKKLAKEYQFLRHQYQLTRVDLVWSFAKTRPANFPTIRMAQLAGWIHRSEHLFSNILEKETLTEVWELLECSVSSYWTNHYVFEKISINKEKSMGETALQHIFLNTIIPFLFLYGKVRGKVHLRQKALDWLELLPPESNKIIEGWAKIGIEARSGADSQALLQLKKHYCEAKKCLDCKIGHHILSI